MIRGRARIDRELQHSVMVVMNGRRVGKIVGRARLSARKRDGSPHVYPTESRPQHRLGIELIT